MDDLSYRDPPVEVVATSPRLDMIMSRLRMNGLRPRLAEPNLMTSALPLIIDTLSAPESALKDLKIAAASGLVRPVILLCNRDIRISGVITLAKDAELATLASRLESLRRKTQRETELYLRRATAKSLGVHIAPIDTDAKPGILYLGDGSAFFLALQSELQQKGIEITAALSVHTALDYLQQRRFSVLLVDMSHGAAHAVQLLKLSENNANVAAQPIFVCLRDGDKLDSTEREALSYATEIIDPAGSVLDTAERLSLLVFSTAVNQPSLTETTCRPKLTDRATGLFTRAYIQAHLARQIEAAEDNETALTILTLKLKSGADQDIAARSAQTDLARMVKPLLRETDCGARYDDTMLVLSLPSTNYSGAVQLAGRIVERLGGDNLGAPGTPLPFGGSLSWRAVERRRYHTADTLISSAMIGPFSRVQVA